MAPKKTNIKIKHSKFNLYNKKKSKARRALKAVLTIIIICGLGVLGYGLGKPLLKYIQNKGENTSQEESVTSALLSSIMNTGSSSGSSGSNVASGSQTPGSNSGSSGANPGQPTPPQNSSDNIYYLPDNAAENMKSLSSALAKAKSSGCSVVAATLKDASGHVLYRTSIKEIKDTDTVTGTLTAEQIAQAISQEGLTPAAKINTLMDPLGSIYVEGNYTFPPEKGGYCWYDNKAEKGGKAWMSPFKSQSTAYIGNITSELSKAGFKHVICANTRFPAFYNNDISSYLSHLPLKDSTKRVNALWDVVNSAKSSAEKNGAKIWVEISGTNLTADEKSSTDAELVTDKEKLKSVKIVVNYDISNTAPKPTNTSNTSDTSSGSIYYRNAKSFASKAKSALGGAEFVVHLPQSLTDAPLADVKKALSEADISFF